MDVTITLAKAGHQISYNGNAIAYTEAPESVSDFLKQRYRWTFGGFQVISKHKSMLFNPKYKQMGLIGMPYFAFFPWIDVLISLLFMAAIVRVSINGNILDLLFFFILMSSIQGLLIFYSMFIDKEQKRLTFFSGSDSLWYSHLISYITIKAGINFLRGSKTSWNKLTRLGKNFAPTS